MVTFFWFEVGGVDDEDENEDGGIDSGNTWFALVMCVAYLEIIERCVFRSVKTRSRRLGIYEASNFQSCSQDLYCLCPPYIKH